MDTTISPNINININSLSSSSSSQSNLISELLKQQISHHQQPPDFLNSINELRELSTALSAFLHDFDDLRNHITSISSAIDAQLPPHLLLNTNATEAVVAERNPNGTEKSNGQFRHANNDAADDDDLRKVLEETNDKLEGIDVLLNKKKESDSLVSEEDIDIWKMIEDIDCDDDDDDSAVSKKKKRKEADIIDKINMLLKKEPEKSDSFRKAGDIDKSKEDEDREIEKKEESDSLVSEEDIDVWKMIEDIDCDDHDDNADIIDKVNVLLKKEPEKSDSFRKAGEIDKSKEDEGTDISKEEEEREIEKKKHEENDVSKEDGEIEILEDGEIDTLEDGEIDILKEEDREIDVSKKKPEEIDVSKEDGEIDLEDGEIDMSKESDEITISKKKPKGIDISKKPKGIDISKKKKQHKEIDIYREADEIRISKQHEEILISKRKRRHEEIDKAKKKHEEIDKSKKKHEAIDVLKKKHEEIDNLKKKKDEEIDISKKKHDETNALKRPAEIDVSKKPEISDTLWKPEAEIDILTKPKERETSKEDGEDDTFKKPAENEASKKLVENDMLNKPEEIDVPKEPQEETDASKKPVEIDILNKPEEIDVSKKPQDETDASKKPVEIDVVNQPEEADVLNKPEEIDVSKKPVEIDVSNKPEEIDVSNKPEEIDVSNKPEEIDVSNKADEIDASKKPAIAVLELLCKEMCAKEMKEHVLAHISEMNSLHQEIAKALKLAINPAKLVLDSIGRFFLQSSRAYYYGESRHEQIAARQASVLILECFVMISGDGIEITKEDKEYAENAAIDWRKRMIKDGGLMYNAAIDARGLLLFISGFGIPDGVFSNENIRDLIRASNVKEIINALRRSTILIPKLPEVIDWMVNNNLEIEAADIAYTFGLEDKCHPETILMAFLHNKIEDTQNGSSLQVNAAMMQQLSDLKSIRRCLETHKIDPSKFLPGVKINEKIEQLEKVINELDLKSTEGKSALKRKEKETEFSKDLNHQQAKRICFSHENLPHEQNPHDHYGRSTQPSCSYFYRNLPNNYVTTYSASSVFSAPVLTPNTTSSVPGGLAGSYGPFVYGGPVAEPMAHINNPWPYGWHGGQPYSRQSQVYGSYPSTADFYGRPPRRAPAESYPGLPDHSLPGGSFGRQVPSSDLYRFADTVVERGSHGGPRAVGSSTTRSSYLH